jgi:hypothetical protein
MAGALLSTKVEALAGLGSGAEAALADPARAVPGSVLAEPQTVEVVAQPITVPSAATASLAAAPTKPSAPMAAHAAASPMSAAAPAAVGAAAARSGADDIATAKIGRPSQARPGPPDDDDDIRDRIQLAAQRAGAAVDPAPAAPAVKPAIEATPAAAARPRPPAQTARPRKVAEPKIFVPPRAPDDPGLDPGPRDSGESAEFGPFRPTSAKA